MGAGARSQLAQTGVSHRRGDGVSDARVSLTCQSNSSDEARWLNSQLQHALRAEKRPLNIGGYLAYRAPNSFFSVQPVWRWLASTSAANGGPR